MDHLEEWEILPHDDLYFDYQEDLRGHEKRLSSTTTGKFSSYSKLVFNTNYFMCPSSPPKSNSRSTVTNNQLVPVPFQLDPTSKTKDDDQEGKKASEVVMIMPKVKEFPNTEPNYKETEDDQDSVSQVFFKKMKENEFVDMKLDSPKSKNNNSFLPPPQLDGTFSTEAYNKGTDQAMEAILGSSPKKASKEEVVAWKESDNGECEDGGGMNNIWKWGLTGIGAICSFGVAAAATICIVVLGTHQKNKHQQQNKQLRLQIYTDDKRINQVVHHATKLNEAISTVRGVPITRAHITFGGYYDGL